MQFLIAIFLFVVVIGRIDAALPWVIEKGQSKEK